MKKLNGISKLLAMGAFTCFSMSQSFAAFVTPDGTCTTDSVTITRIEVSPLDDAGILGFPTTNATSCFGMAEGNDGNVHPDNNIGQIGDGLLNGEIIKKSGLGMDPYFFLTSGDKLLDLDGNGVATDPGWIELGRAQGAGAGKEVTYNSITNGAKTLAIKDVLSLGLTCTTTQDVDCSSGAWFLETKGDIITKVQEVLGRNSFDHLAFVFKAGQEWAVYDFNFNVLSAALPVGAFDFVTPYSFMGDWNTNDFGNAKALSHFSIWARDPAPAGNDVPEPATLALLAVGLLVMRFSKKV